ncbi:hypothetical protein CXF85_17805 [Colwellia sp. 75C3]|nr:hypothetical protein CXF85_17805 [Colwellia sp. 75C3]
MSLFVRTFCFYIVITLIALQSVNAISAINDSHQDSHQSSQQNSHLSSHQQNIAHSYQDFQVNHQDSDHHSEAELIAFQTQTLDGQSTHSDADHPDCHSNHCHHSNLIYLDLSSQVHLSITTDKQVINKAVLFNSLPVSPDSRPPIV